MDLFPFVNWSSEYTREEAALFGRLTSENGHPTSVLETLVAKHCWICLRAEDAETLRTTGQFSLRGIYAGQFNLSLSARAALWRRGLWQTQTEEPTVTVEQTWTLVAFRFTTEHFINLVTEGTLRFFNRRYSDYIVTTDPGLTEVPFTLNAQEQVSVRRWTLVDWEPKDLFARSTAADWHRNCRRIVIGATVWTEATAIQLGEFITDELSQLDGSCLSPNSRPDDDVGLRQLPSSWESSSLMRTSPLAHGGQDSLVVTRHRPLL